MDAGDAAHLTRGHAIIATVAVFYALAMALIGWQNVQSLRRSFQHERLDQQVAVARLKAEQIDDWSRERRMNLQFLGRSLSTLPLAAVSGNPDLHKLVELTLAQFLASNPERIAAGLFRPDGAPLVTVGAFDPAHDPDLRQEIHRAANQSSAVVGTLRVGGAGPDGLSIAFARAIDTTVPGQPAGTLVLVSVLDPTLGVFKGFANWPTASPTSQVELIFRNGNEIVHIVPDREFQSAAPLSLRNPVRNDRLFGNRADLIGRGVWDAVDHHDRRVLAASYPVTDFPWTVVAKTDYREAMQPIDWETRKIWAMIVALILFGGVLSLALGAQLTMADALRRNGRNGT